MLQFNISLGNSLGPIVCFFTSSFN